MDTAFDIDFLRDRACDFLSREVKIDDLRALREKRSGFDRDLWAKISELGWPGITFAEEFGGQALGYAALGTILTELGRSLTPTPFLSTIVLAGEAIRLGGHGAMQYCILPEVIAGRRFLAFAHHEGSAFRPYDISVTARYDNSSKGFVLRGSKALVLDAHVADSLVVVARTSGAPDERDGLTLFLVSVRSPGVRISPELLIDSRVGATVDFNDVKAPVDQILGECDRGAELLDPVLVRGNVALAAEILGGIEACFAKTISYLQQRQEFGVVIGSFQALQHRAADWLCEIEMTRAIVEEALRHVDDVGSIDAEAYASAAKARASEVFMRSAEESIQMFGGIGMTDAHDIGFFLKRARAAEQTLGDSAYHRAHFAKLRGF